MAALNLLGDAAKSGNVLRPAPSTADPSREAVGAAWFTDKQPVGDGFQTVFQFQTTDPRVGGGDGFAFVIQNFDLDVLGLGGQHIGYGVIPNSIAVEFDFKRDVPFVDPSNNHISVHTRGVDGNDASEKASIGAVSPRTNLSDGRRHTVRIVYKPGSLTVFLDNMRNPVLEVPLDIASTLKLDNGRAWVGFTASSRETQNTDILSWSFSPVVARAVAAPTPTPAPAIRVEVDSLAVLEVFPADGTTLAVGQEVVVGAAVEVVSVSRENRTVRLFFETKVNVFQPFAEAIVEGGVGVVKLDGSFVVPDRASTRVVALLEGDTPSTSPSEQAALYLIAHPPVAAPATGESVLRINSNPFNTLDPQDPNRAAAAIPIIVELFSGLVALNSDQEVVPDIATGWEIQNGVVYTFKLNQDARFHNGDPVTAQDFKWSMEKAAKSMAESSLATSYLGDIVGAERFIVGITTGIRGIQVVDDLALRIIIDAPKPYFLAKLASPLAFVLHRVSVESGGPEWWAENLVGTGPFILARYAPGELIVLKNNHEYYGDPVGVDTVLINLLRSGQDVPMYETGEIDVARIGGFDVFDLRESGHPLINELTSGPAGLGVFYIGFNVAAPPFDDVQFRRALAHAVDRELINRELLRGVFPPAHNILPPLFPGVFSDPEGVAYDPELAMRLLEESAYADPATRPPVVVSSSGGAIRTDILSLIAEMWRQNLGVEVEIEIFERAGFFERLNAQDLRAFYTVWSPAYPDPHAVLDLFFHSASGLNNTGYINPKVDELLEAARVEQDPEVRKVLYREAHHIIVNDVPWLPLWFFGKSSALVKPYVKGYELTPFGVRRLSRVRIERPAAAAAPDISLGVVMVKTSGLDAFFNGAVGVEVGEITRVNWAWGDGSSEDSWFPAEHTYPGPGTYNLRVTAHDDLGRSKTVTRTVVVELPAPVGKIAFTSDRDGNQEIYIMAVDGSNQTRLTFDPAGDFTPDISPDGQKIAFTTERHGLYDIYVMGIDGSNPTRLTFDPAHDGSPSWSPDGTTIAFWSSRGDDLDARMIYLMEADGSNQKPLPGSVGDTEPQWSPDGTQIVVQSFRDNPKASEIFVMDADGSNPTRLTTDGHNTRPNWSPDGTKIAFLSTRDGNGEIYVMDADGSNQTRLTVNSSSDAHPSWSPDGTKIAFQSLRDGDHEIYLMDADGSNQTPITANTAKDQGPSWSPVKANVVAGAVVTDEKVRSPTVWLTAAQPPVALRAAAQSLKAAPQTTDPLLDVRYLSQSVSHDAGADDAPQALQTEASQVVALAFIEHVDPSKGWALQNDGTVLTTDDAGKSWRVVATNLVTCCDGDLFFINHDTGWAVGGEGQVARTDDGGRRWTRYRSGTDFALEDVYFLDGERIFATAGGELLRSSNMGIAWKPVASSQGPRSITFLPTDHNYGWVVGDGGDVLLTRDSGESWIAAWNEPGGAVAGAELTSAHFVTKDLGWAVSRDAVILRTLDGGLTWERVFEANRKGLRAVTFTTGGAGWAVGDDGLVVRFEPAEAALALAAEVFIEDFERDFADRVQLPEGWEIMEQGDSNHVLFGGFTGRPGVGVEVIAVPQAEEYTFQLGMYPEAPEISPTIAIAGGDGLYKLQFDVSANETIINVVKVGPEPAYEVEWSEESTVGPMENGVWHALVIEVLPDKFQLRVDGQLVLARDDPDPFLRGGATVSLVEDRGKTLFDNIGLKGVAAAAAPPVTVTRASEPAAPVKKQEPEPAPAPEPEEERGFLINRRPGEEALPIEALLDPVTLTIISIFVTIAATFVQLVRGR